MKVIYKYTLPVLEKFTIELPGGADIIRVDDVDGQFFLWAIIDNEAAKETRYIECYKTGQAIETPLEDLKYLGCCKLFIMQELCLYMFENVSPRQEKCPDALLPDGPICPGCGGRRGASGVDGGSWVHF